MLWTDTSTVLTWLNSESYHYKVFVGNRVAEIQELAEDCSWRYVDSASNPADDLTRGKPLNVLTKMNRWSQGPPFLLQDPANWPVMPGRDQTDNPTELRKSVFCGTTAVPHQSSIPDALDCHTWQELLDATAKEIQANTTSASFPDADDYRRAEILILKRVQQESFPNDYERLEKGKPVSSDSRLLTLAPELDKSSSLIRVGGRLRRAETIDESTLHPIVLDAHPVTQLLIKHYDCKLHHPGAERVFAEIRRHYWIIRGREAIRRHQHKCFECQRWRAQPTIPKMADLPSARLRLHKPAFHSCGVDCFGPMLIKIGRRTEKRWGIIFKCLTVHLDLLNSMNSDSFLMALR